MDDYYCIIVLFNNRITLYLWNSNKIKEDTQGLYPICFTASSANILYSLITKHHIVQKLSLMHIFYLSQELYKAELCSFFSQKYTQS